MDNGSDTHNPNLLKLKSENIIKTNEIKSPYYCKNVGFANSTGNIIAFLDSNCMPSSTWLNNAMQMLSLKKADILTAEYEFEYSDNPSIYEFADRLLLNRMEDFVLSGKSLPGGNVVMYKKTFERVGKFLENIRSLADIEWSLRATKMGFRLGLITKSNIRYPAKNKRNFLLKAKRMGKGKRNLWRNIEGKSWPFIYMKSLQNLLPPKPLWFWNYFNKQKDPVLKGKFIPLYFITWQHKLYFAKGLIER